MNDEEKLTPEQLERLRKLLAYMDRWQAAHKAWLKWIDGEYARRLGAFKAFRRQAQDKLIESAGGLKFNDRRVDGHTRGGIRAKRKMLRSANQVYAAVVLKGQQVFAVSGKRDAAGIFRGNIEPAFKRQALKALLDCFRG